jgi:hypothetical protein
MTIDPRLPALRRLRQQLQDDASALRRSVLLSTAQGQDATGFVLQQRELEAQIEELDDVIEERAERAHNDGKVEVTKHALIAATFLYLILMIPILYLLFAANVGQR